MRRIDKVKDKRIRNVKSMQILDKKRIKIEFNNGGHIILTAMTEEFGYDEGIYIEKDTE